VILFVTIYYRINGLKTIATFFLSFINGQSLSFIETNIVFYTYYLFNYFYIKIHISRVRATIRPRTELQSIAGDVGVTILTQHLVSTMHNIRFKGDVHDE